MRTRTTILGLTAACLLVLEGCVPGGPRAEFSASRWLGYPPLEVLFNAGASSSPNGEIVSYEWQFGDGESGGGRTTEHTFAEKGVYPVILTVTDAQNAMARVTHHVQVLSLAPISTFTFRPYMAPKGSVVTFDASASRDPDGEIVDYVWDFGDGTTDVGVVVEHVFSVAMRYTVRLTVVDNDGVSESSEKQVTITGCNTCG